jgi:ATP-dependent exoDNAse (exonuclease V) alpha subunit
LGEQKGIAVAITEAVNQQVGRLFFIQGGAGAGKSFMLRKIRDHVGEAHVVEMAPTGVAAQNLSLGAQTIHAALNFRMSEGTTLNEPSVKLRMRFKVAKLVVIDEISMVAAKMLGRVFARLKQLSRDAMSDDDFGGFVVVVCGDFWQISPVASQTIINIFMEKQKHVDAWEIHAKVLWAKARVFTMLGNRRANECEVQKKLSNLLRSPIPLPITDELIGLVRHYNHSDARDDPLWRNPTFLVPTNEERKTLNLAAVKRFAKYTKQPVIQFTYETGSFAARNQVNLDKIREHSMLHQGLFAIGAPVMISTNVSTACGIANGVMGKVFGFRYENETDQEMFNLAIQQGAPGVEVELPTPKFMLIELPFDVKYIPTPFHGKVESRRVVPLCVSEIEEEISVQGVAKQLRLTWSGFPCELSYAITFHKCQGLTLDRVVVCANKRPTGKDIVYEQLLVALTRVRKNDHLRFMPLAGNTGASMDHLKRLPSNPSVIAYFAGEFDPHTNVRRR